MTPTKKEAAGLRDTVAQIIGSYVVVDDHGGPDTVTLHDELGGNSYEENTRRLYELTDEVLSSLPASAPAAGVEEAVERAARIIDPWAFKQYEWASRDDNTEALRTAIREIEAARTKAREIFSALPVSVGGDGSSVAKSASEGLRPFASEGQRKSEGAIRQPQDIATDWLELARAAERYFDRYCQDEAADDFHEFVGCSSDQHADAAALRDALKDVSADELVYALCAATAPQKKPEGEGS
jgi:hypothetical protein